MFEMLTHWPERNTFKSMKPIDFPLYKQMIKDPIALDPIMDKIDINSSEQVTLFLYVHCLTLLYHDYEYTKVHHNVLHLTLF